jgi:hypothetical protein
MHHKMDAGCEVKSIIPKSSYEPQSKSRVIALMDSLLSKNMEWMGGALLAMTTHSCVYFKTPPKNRFLLIFMKLFSFQMMHAYNTIITSQIFFEEDFMADLSGFTLGLDKILFTVQDASSNEERYLQFI